MSHFWPEAFKFVSSGEKSHRERIFLKKVTQISQISQIFLFSLHLSPFTIHHDKVTQKSQKSQKFFYSPFTFHPSPFTMIRSRR